MKILTANHRFLNELGWKDKHEPVRHMPRMVLESPIDPESVSSEKVGFDKIRIGKHSLRWEINSTKST